MKPCLLQLAKFDFNLVLITHQKELRRMLAWGKMLGLGGRTNFTRDGFLECYFCAAGIVCLPKYGFGREELTKAGVLITILDDVYDVSGSLHELQLFTKAVAKWECHGCEELLEYMKICYTSLYNTADELAIKIMLLQGIFHGMLEKDIISWKVILAGYVQNVAWMGSLTSIDYWLDYSISEGNAASINPSLLIEIYASIPAVELDRVVTLSFLVAYLGSMIAPRLHRGFSKHFDLEDKVNLDGWGNVTTHWDKVFVKTHWDKNSKREPISRQCKWADGVFKVNQKARRERHRRSENPRLDLMRGAKAPGRVRFTSPELVLGE